MKLVSSPTIYHEMDNHVETFVGGDSWTANKCTTAYEHFLFHTCSLLWLHKKIYAHSNCNTHCSKSTTVLDGCRQAINYILLKDYTVELISSEILLFNQLICDPLKSLKPS